MDPLAQRRPEELAECLRASGRRRGYLVLDPATGAYRASHPELQGLAAFLAAESRDCRGHEAVFFEAAPESRTLLSAFVHKTVRGQAQGGLRHWRYERLEDLLRDGLRLSRGMTRKAAAAGLWWGGGKGIVARTSGDACGDPARRRRLFREYGAFISSLRGCYLTAEDAGTTPPDVAEVFRATRFVTCIPPEAGGAGNPSEMTAVGVVRAMEAALAFRGEAGLAGRVIALQGTGHVGSAMIPELLERGVARIVASELSPARRAALLDRFAGDPLEVRPARPDDDSILAEPCDVLAPCALGAVLGPKTIPSLRAKIVCGAANNQLVDDERDARAIEERGITYVPDFLANRMGIVHCGNEQYGYVTDDPMLLRHLGREWQGGIYRTVLAVLARARDEGVCSARAANELADERAEEPHPIWGHRAWQIIQSLVADRWDTS